MKKIRKKKAFSIVKPVTLIAMIAVLIVVVVPIFFNIIDNAQDSKAVQEAKNAHTEYINEHVNQGEIAKYMVYETNGRFVALKGGVAVGVYETSEDAIKAMVPEADMSKLTGTNDGKLFVYGGVRVKESLAGKKISFMGDSISTYLNWSNNTAFNTTLGGNDERNNRVYYERDDRKGLLSSVHYTWWMMTVERLGLELCVNNSWTGSRVVEYGPENKYGCGTRTQNLHNDNTDEPPDIIVVYMGTNDVNHGVALGDFNSLEDIYNSETETYTGTLTQFAPAYATMVHKIKTKYPEADIYLCTVDQYAFQQSRDPAAYNQVIKTIAEYFDCSIVDFNSGTSITRATISDYTVDLNLHPNAKGMTQMYECVKNALDENYQVTELHDQPIFSRDKIQNLKVSSLKNSATHVYMYTKNEVIQSLSGKTVTRIGVPIKSVQNCTQDSYFTVYVVDSTEPYTKHCEYKITIPANLFSANSVNQWAYFDVDIKLKEGQTLAFQTNSSATLGYIANYYTSAAATVSEIGGFSQINMVTGTEEKAYTSVSILYDIFVK